MIETVIHQYEQQTVIEFKMFGYPVASEHYPKYYDGSGALMLAVKDAQQRFARKMREALT